MYSQVAVLGDCTFCVLSFHDGMEMQAIAAAIIIKRQAMLLMNNETANGKMAKKTERPTEMEMSEAEQRHTSDMLYLATITNYFEFK